MEKVLKNTIVVVTEYFYPSLNSTSYYLTNIVKKLSGKNTVKVICNTNLRDNKELNIDNLEIIRAKEINLNKNNIFTRTLKFLFSSVKLSILVYKNIKQEENVLAVTNPAFIIIFLAIIKKFKKFNYTLLVYDIFPENLISAKILRKDSFFYKFIEKIYNWSYLKTDRLVVIGRDMAEVVANKTDGLVPVFLIENWCDFNTIIPSCKHENEILRDLKIIDKKIFLFAGNLGRLQGIKNMLDAAELVENNDFLLLFIGDGVMKKDIEEHIKISKKNNVIYAGSFPMSEQNKFLNACDVAIVSLSDSMYGLGVPSKSYFSMASGKPILYIGDKNSEIGRVVNENNIGWVVENSNSLELVNKFNQILEISSKNLYDLGIRAREVVSAKYSEETILKKYDELYY
ncbi:hypothetical protein SDC9_24041 [bioreactor metagenome]|uniref:Glycosyl transferase family 1 domain-containing protein n=1 Tax=bioreactor metagenome TaxID=1076179 RepID=A0A644UGR0_9ZZZZ